VTGNKDLAKAIYQIEDRAERRKNGSTEAKE
jgi:hypothetical protein